jgi:hypothetical protein
MHWEWLFTMVVIGVSIGVVPYLLNNIAPTWVSALTAGALVFAGLIVRNKIF